MSEPTQVQINLPIAMCKALGVAPDSIHIVKPQRRPADDDSKMIYIFHPRCTEKDLDKKRLVMLHSDEYTPL